MAYELFVDGFDYYATEDITKKWQYYDNRIAYIEADTGRRGTGALYLANNQAYGFGGGIGLIRSMPFTPSTHVVVGFALKIQLGGALNTFWLKSIADYEFAVRIDGRNGLFHCYRSGAAIAETSTYSIPSLAYCYVEIGIHYADAGSYEVRVNGQTILKNESYDTKNSSATGISVFEIANQEPNPGNKWLDDFYIAYGDEIKFLGDSRVDTLALTANSTPQDWTPDTGNAWERLNQDAGYIASSTVNAVSLFAAGDISHNPSTIHGIQINGHAYKSDAGYREAAMVLKSGGTTDVGTPLALATDTLLIREPYIVDPNTGSAFTKANLNAIEVGAKVTA